MNQPGRVVVGVASAGTRSAVRYAAAEADARHADLHLVTARPAATGGRDPDEAEQARLLATMADEIADEWPELFIGTELVAGPPAAALRAAASEAALLVVGADTAGSFAEAISGSVPGELLTTAPCPLVVMPGQEGMTHEAGPIVVAFDGPDTSRAALVYAFAAAARSGNEVTVLHCGPSATGGGAGGDLALVGFRELYPDVPVTVETSQAPPKEALAAAARTASALVLGSRGRGGLASGRFGSVTRDLIRRSPCPVVVARATNAGPSQTPGEQR